jgi:hypothetical protein
VEGFHSIVGPTEKMMRTFFQQIPAFQMSVMVQLEASTFIQKQAT